MGKATCAECGAAVPKGRCSFCSRRCQKAAERKRYRGKRVPMGCARCGKTFMGRRWGDTGPEHKHRYCSVECEAAAKAERYGIACEHGPSGGQRCVVCNFVENAAATKLSIRPIFRFDPCAFCGRQPSGIDHIDPICAGGADEWMNWTGCCHRCNAIKAKLPLLAALLWLPISREYHDLKRQVYG